MKITDADVLWVPAYSKVPDAGDIVVKRHGTHRRAQYPNHMWMPATDMGPYGIHPTRGDPIKQLLAMMLTDKLVLALAATVLALTIAVASTPPAGGKSDALKTYRPAETACNVG
jgi:hypothetical protein